MAEEAHRGDEGIATDVVILRDEDLEPSASSDLAP
jgi:hypothetical protein